MGVQAVCYVERLRHGAEPLQKHEGEGGGESKPIINCADTGMRVYPSQGIASRAYSRRRIELVVAGLAPREQHRLGPGVGVLFTR